MKAIISMPLYIEMGIKKSKKMYINLNNYRNWHFQVSNNLKAKYKEIFASKLGSLAWGGRGLKLRKTSLTFYLHRGDRRKVDRANILSIHEKFFCDALVECGCLTDDDDSFIESTHYYTGCIDKENPRVDIVMEEIK